MSGITTKNPRELENDTKKKSKQVEIDLMNEEIEPEPFEHLPPPPSFRVEPHQREETEPEPIEETPPPPHFAAVPHKIEMVITTESTPHAADEGRDTV